MRFVCCEPPMTVGAWAADYVAQRILDFAPGRDRPFILGLPTGSTPLAMYQHLIQKHRAGQLSFEHVLTFNLDEYVGLAPGHPQSYHSYMNQEFFRHIDLPAQNIHILDGNATDLEQECQQYETAISARGGLDLCIGGVGEAGHIAFNEAGGRLNSRTHLQRLDASTRSANARFFEQDANQVPTYALTMGVGTILEAREVMILATGPRKALAVYHALEGQVTPEWPVSALQKHGRSLIVCDEAAAQKLTIKA